MGQTLELGRRIEIQPMDGHCRNISLGLYRQLEGGAPQYLVHTYSTVPGAAERVAFVRQCLITLLGLEPASASADSSWLRFPCCFDHMKALRRGFLDVCKLETGAPLAPKPLSVFDKKADCQLSVVPQWNGVYEIQTATSSESAEKRSAALARGLIKICEMESMDDSPHAIRFACGSGHDELLGMLMFRAQNVRAAMQEEEMSAGRGVLAPPSQQ